MGILDEAIREHLALKRQHGADDAELKQLEDEAFGPPERPGASSEAPDPFAEAPTEFLAQPELSDAVSGESQAATEEDGEPHPEPSRREAPSAGILDLQEAPQPAQPAEEAQPAAEDQALQEPIPSAESTAPSKPEEDPAAAAGPDATEEPPAQPAEAEEEPQASHTTEEREAIAEQPTQFFDVEQELSGASAADSPSVEQVSEEPLPEAVSVDDDEEFFSEQRLSDELDRALEGPGAPDHGADEQDAVADRGETGEYEASEGSGETDEHEASAENGETGEYEYEQPSTEAALSQGYESVEEDDAAEPQDASLEERNEHEDVLEDTPDFLEGSEDEQLWFEQKPPKDFDFDD